MGSRREFLGAAGGLVGSVLLGKGVLGREKAQGRPNIVFIMVDDLGKEYVGCYGGQRARTPNIDRLAAGGMRFVNAYSMPQCVPTRLTLLTGQYPFRHGWVDHYDVPRWGKGCHYDLKQNPCMGRVMRSAGYRTCIAGKWQINDFRLQPKVLEDAGFEEYCVWTGYEQGNPPSGERYWDAYLHTKEGSRTYKGQFGPDVCNQFVLDFIAKHKDEPFMVYYPMSLTHAPWTTTPHSGDVKNKKVMVEYMDHLVGRVAKALDDAGVRGNTIVVWTTDNGEAKGKTKEGGVCEPFVVNGPGRVPDGVVSDALVDFTDLLPTFAELGGGVPEAGYVYDGKSFASLILGKEQDSQREWIMAMGGGAGKATKTGDGWRVFSRFAYRDRVIRDKRYKIYVGTDGRVEKMVDLQEDPLEEPDIKDSRKPEMREALQKLKNVAAGFPQKDASPRYTPLPPGDWEK